MFPPVFNRPRGAPLLMLCTALAALHAQPAGARRAPPCPKITPVKDAEVASAQLKEQTSFAAPALTLARSQEADHLRQLGKVLIDITLLSKRFDQNIPAIRCQLLPVLDALAENPAAEARRQYLRLLTARPFIKSADRIDALIRSSAFFRPAPRALVRFWRRYSRPRDCFVNLTVPALAENGTRPAIALFVRLLKDKRHTVEDRRIWIRWDVLEHRHGLALLRAARRLLRRGGGLPTRLRHGLVEALFDYRPEKWCRPDSCMTPPPRKEMQADARQELRLIAARALKMKLGERLVKVIRQTLAELDQLDGK